jgi:predicted nucleic acid-binding protein
LILVDSSGWIEYLAARPKADKFAPYIEGDEPLVTSVIQVYEIYKVVRRDISEERAIESISALRATRIEPLAESLALEAADIALEHGLAMADAIIFATARKHDAEIITADSDFDGLPGVTLIR